jgi:hypothetical protein
MDVLLFHTSDYADTTQFGQNGNPPPYYNAVVDQHFDVLLEYQVLILSQSVEISDVAYPAEGIVLVDPAVKTAVAVSGVFVFVVERPIGGETASLELLGHPS